MTPKQRAEEAARSHPRIISAHDETALLTETILRALAEQQAEHEAERKHLDAKIAQLEIEGPIVDGGIECELNADDRPVGGFTQRRIPMRQALRESEMAAEAEANECDRLRAERDAAVAEAIERAAKVCEQELERIGPHVDGLSEARGAILIVRDAIRALATAPVDTNAQDARNTLIREAGLEGKEVSKTPRVDKHLQSALDYETGSEDIHWLKAGVELMRQLERALTEQQAEHEAERDAVVAETLERAAQKADSWSKPDSIKLAAGEMTAQELRTAIAVAKGIASAIRALAPRSDMVPAADSAKQQG